METSRRVNCQHCREKGVVIIPDGTLVCYTHYNRWVLSGSPKGKAVIRDGR